MLEKKAKDALEAAQAEKAAQEKITQELERLEVRFVRQLESIHSEFYGQIDKENEVAALRAKLANQASGQTPRTRRQRVMGPMDFHNISTRMPTLSLVPIAIPETEASSEDDGITNLTKEATSSWGSGAKVSVRRGKTWAISCQTISEWKVKPSPPESTAFDQSF